MSLELFLGKTIILAICIFANVNGHGRLLEPPSRSSLFRFAYSDPTLIPYRDIIKPNYLDNQLYCGGKQVQTDNNGKCGVCGDPYTAEVKDNEAGGKYALGIITRNYKQGDIINVTVEITAEHKGYFEFRLCPWNNVDIPVTHECLNQNILKFDSGDTIWRLPNDPSAAIGFHHLKVQLPQEITCTQCVLQWRYRTGNSWGYENGEGGPGLGQQEEFYGCSDVAIHSSGDHASSLASLSTTSTNPSSKLTTITTFTITDVDVIEERSSSTEIVTQETKTISTTSNAVDFYPDIDCNEVELGQPIFRDCHSFYICAFHQYDPYLFGCPDGTVCDPKSGKCDRPEINSICNILI